MSNDDIPADQPADSPTTDTTETAADGGAVATEEPKSRFWGVVPTEWELVDGSEIYDVNPSYTPDEEEITYIEMDALDTDLPFPRYSKKRKAEDYSGKLFRKGDTLFARITPCTENGKAAFVDEMETDVGIGSTEYAVLSPDRERIHPLYLYYVAKSHPVRNYAISRMRGSTGRQRVPFDVFRRELDVSLPPMEEQEQVISVLFNIDKALKASREIHSKLDRVQTGIEQDIFTNGLQSDGKIEETRGVEYPSDWKFEPLEDHVITSAFGPRFNSNKYDSGGNIATLRTTDLDEGGRITYETMPVASLEFNEFEEHILKPGDFLITRSGTTGIGCVWKGHDFPTIPGAFLIRFRLENTLLPEYLRYYVNSTTGGSRVQRRAKGGVQKNLAGSDLLQMRFPIPPVEIQEQIIEILSDLEERKIAEERYQNQLKKVRSGLMQDLMTGSVRSEGIEVTESVIKDE